MAAARTEERLKKKKSKTESKMKTMTNLAMLMPESEMITCDGRLR